MNFFPSVIFFGHKTLDPYQMNTDPKPWIEPSPTTFLTPFSENIIKNASIRPLY